MASNGYIILVEGQADLTFLRDVLKYLFKELEAQPHEENRELTRIDLTKGAAKITLYSTKGYTRIKKVKSNIAPYLDAKRDLLVVFDADTSETKGGFKERLAEIKTEVKKHLNIELTDSQIFLFPDNHSDGTLEDLLLKLVNPSLFEPFIEPFLSYAEAIENLPQKLNNPQISETFYEEIASKKNRVFNYFQVYQGKKFAKESGRDYFRLNLWNFKSEALKPLIDFFKQNISIS